MNCGWFLYTNIICEALCTESLCATPRAPMFQLFFTLASIIVLHIVILELHSLAFMQALFYLTLAIIYIQVFIQTQFSFNRLSLCNSISVLVQLQSQFFIYAYFRFTRQTFFSLSSVILYLQSQVFMQTFSRFNHQPLCCPSSVFLQFQSQDFIQTHFSLSSVFMQCQISLTLASFISLYVVLLKLQSAVFI